MMREFGRERRCPASPAASSREPMEDAWPTQSVLMGLLMYCRHKQDNCVMPINFPHADGAAGTCRVVVLRNASLRCFQDTHRAACIPDTSKPGLWMKKAALAASKHIPKTTKSTPLCNADSWMPCNKWGDSWLDGECNVTGQRLLA